MMSKRRDAKCKYLVDTSALFPLLVSGIPFNSDECAVSTLTEYEVGNVLWRESQQGKLENPRRVAAIFSEAVSRLGKFNFDSLPDVLAIAIERNLTFCDASYACIAEKHKLKLVTQDTDLLSKCEVAIPIDKMNG